MYLIFLGSGGGRWVTLNQKMRTGGFRLHAEGNIHIDPGPSAMLAMKEMRIDPIKTDAVFVTHCHPDHYNDAEVLIEAMTVGAREKRGTLFASKSVIVGIDSLGPAISKYHQEKVLKKYMLEVNQKAMIDRMEVETLPTKHSDPTAVGLKFHTKEGTITYSSDTEFFEGLYEAYKDSDILILNTLRPKADRIPCHLCTEDVIKITKEIKPKLVILTHFGMKMLKTKSAEARRVEKETGIRTMAATDGIRLNIHNILKKSQSKLDTF
ncbi:MAG: MBL fold metallo-hydrolase [Candidatus Hydrothermarchaeales archaeon]